MSYHSKEPVRLKRCIACAEDIRAEATICHYCDSHQNWRGRLTVGSTVLSLLVALLAVLGVVVPIFKDALTEKDSDLSVSFQGNAGGGFAVLITNAGIRPGTVDTMTFVRPVGEAGYIAASASRDLMVEPGKSLLVSYQFAVQPKESLRESADCDVLIGLRSFAGVQGQRKISLKCRELMAAKVSSVPPPRP